MEHDNPQYWCALSEQLGGQGKLAEAEAAARRALALDSRHAAAAAQLAHALRWQGKFAEAREAAARATRLAPDLPAAWFNLGAALMGERDIERGIAAYRKALALKPDFAEAWVNLGSALGERGEIAAEIDAYRHALEANADLAPAWSNFGNALREAGELNEAVAACRKALELDPRFAPAWNNLGSALREQGAHEEALNAAQRAAELAPDYAEAWSNLGNALESLGRFDEAIGAHRHAVLLQPDSAEIHFNLGVALKHCDRATEAIAHYRRALSIRPQHADVHWNLALGLLRSGELREGWEEYEWRWRRRNAEPRRHDFTAWDGDATRPRRLLLWAEQGIGDEIIYASMIPDLADTPLAVTLECDARLVALFIRSFPSTAVVPRQDPPVWRGADFDCQSPLASLGRRLRPSFESFPRHAGYLKADAERAGAYRQRLGVDGDPAARLVGISWESKNEEFGALKSHKLAAWSGVLGAPHAKFVDLQYGDTAGERSSAEAEYGVRLEHLADLDLFNDMDGLAALTAACDLVITVSNVTAHMAGALGCPVWLLVPKAKGKIWYWFSNRSDSPWYPSMRIFTQQALGSWREVLDEVARELSAFVQRR